MSISNSIRGIAVLGAEELAGWDFTSGWLAASGGVLGDADSYTSIGGGGIYTSGVITAETKYRIVISGTTTATNIQIRNSPGTTLGLIGTGFGTFDFEGDFEGGGSNLYLRNIGAGATDITKLELYEILSLDIKNTCASSIE